MRKAIQITSRSTIALCDDGTMWERVYTDEFMKNFNPRGFNQAKETDYEWQQLPPIPQDEEKQIYEHGTIIAGEPQNKLAPDFKPCCEGMQKICIAKNKFVMACHQHLPSNDRFEVFTE